MAVCSLLCSPFFYNRKDETQSNEHGLDVLADVGVTSLDVRRSMLQRNRRNRRTRSPLPIPTDATVAAPSSASGKEPFKDTANAALLLLCSWCVVWCWCREVEQKIACVTVYNDGHDL